MVTFPGKKQLSLVIRRYQETTGWIGHWSLVLCHLSFPLDVAIAITAAILGSTNSNSNSSFLFVVTTSVVAS
jgi:hypothetical protein